MTQTPSAITEFTIQLIDFIFIGLNITFILIIVYFSLVKRKTH